MMKTKRVTTTFVSALAVMTLLAACSKKPPTSSTSSDLVGMWKLVEVTLRSPDGIQEQIPAKATELHTEEDGTAILYIEHATIAYKWKVSGTTVTFTNVDVPSNVLTYEYTVTPTTLSLTIKVDEYWVTQTFERM